MLQSIEPRRCVLQGGIAVTVKWGVALLWLCLVATACRPPAHEAAGDTVTTGEGAAALPDAPANISVGPSPAESKDPEPVPSGEWGPTRLVSGKVSVSCETDYAQHGDGEPLESLTFFSVVEALTPCKSRGLVRLHYKGRIAADFTELMKRVSDIANRLEIGKRVLELDSGGGQVEDAMRAGDVIADSRWTIWVREDAICHSACVFVLAAGDNRVVSGRVGIHRMIRMSSTATTRAELSRELQAVHARVKDYLERNGVAVAVADLLMTVPNRDLRLLSAEELQRYGLDGTNAAQDDLVRLVLMRKCGEDFVRRKDGFQRSFEQECRGADSELEQVHSCGLKLRSRYGFPDRTCPEESPLSEFDGEPA